MVTIRSKLVAMLLALGACLTAPVARAQDASTLAPPAEEGVAPEVLDLLRRGVERRVGGDDAVALALFEQALALAPTLGRVRAQIGLAQHALGRWADAEASLERALASDDPWVGRHRSELESSLEVARSHLGTLVVTAEPGVEVRVDELGPWSPAPVEVRADAGPHVVRARGAGRLEMQREIGLAGGERVTVGLSLVPVPDLAVPPEAPHESPRVEAPSESRQGGPDVHPLLFVGLATTLAAAGALIGTHVAATDEQHRDQAQLDGACAAPTDACRSLRDTLEGRLEAFEIAVDALWGALALGATLAGTGLVLTFWDGEPAQVALTPSSLSVRW